MEARAKLFDGGGAWRRRSAPRVLGVAFAVAGLGLAVGPAAASAVTGSVSGNTLTITGGQEANNVDVDGTSQDTLDVQDTAGVTPGPGCVLDQGTPNVIDCGDQTTTRIVMSLGGGDDAVADHCIWCGAIFTWQHPISSFAVDVGDGDNTVNLRYAGGDHGVQAGNGNNTIETYYADSDVAVGNGDNTIDLTNNTNEVVLGDGDNTVNGLDGHDTIHGGAGRNLINEGFACTANVCSVGSLTFYGVDGGADTVTCGTGPNVIYADQFDTFGQDCTNVHRVMVGTGSATPGPKVIRFPAHCARRGGHRTCTAARPLNNHRYHGTTAQGQPITVTVDKHGRFYALSPTKLQFLCPGGDGQHPNTASDGVAVLFGNRQAISKQGAFSTEVDYDPSQGWSHEVVYLVGAFDGHNAKGTIVGNAQIAGSGECSTGQVGWHAHG